MELERIHICDSFSGVFKLNGEDVWQCTDCKSIGLESHWVAYHKRMAETYPERFPKGVKRDVI